MDEYRAHDIRLKIHIFNNRLKRIKKRLPKEVTFLGTYTGVDKEVSVRVVINNKEVFLTIPQTFDLTDQDFNRVEELIFRKCQK